MDNIRIAILSANNTPVAFMDNGHKKSMHYWNDELHEYLQGTANTYTFTVNAKHPDAQHITAGNKVAFTYKGKSYYLNIVNTDQTEQTITATAWSLSFELINEDAGEYKAGKAMSFEEYLAVFDAERTLKLGLNEVSDKRITNEWTGTTSVLKRLFSLANVFSAEIEFETVLNSDYSLKEIVLNVYREHSDTDSGIGEYRGDVVLRYGKGITGIRKTTDAEKLYTCIQPTGKDGLTINGLDKKEYDENGNIEYFTDGAIIRAPQARDRFPSNIVNKEDAYILMRKEYDTDNQDKLYSMALSDLKTASEPVVTYEVDGYFDTNIGDTVRMQDQEWTPVLYLQARVSEQVRSLTDPKTAKTVFSNYKELTSEISDDLIKRMEDLINKNKVYACSIATNNGIIFKNGIGSTTLTAYAYDNGVDVTGNLEIRWSKDGTEFYVGRSVTVNAEDVESEAVYSFVATENGIRRGYYEVTITKVDDGKDGVGIESVTKYYLASEKSTGITVSSPGWTDTKQDMTETKKNLWSYDLIRYTNSTETKTTPVIIGVRGDNGETGDSGIIISPTPPENPKVGQLWQTASGEPIKRWDGSRWVLHYVSVENLDVQTLSAITANLGTIIAGIIKNNSLENPLVFDVENGFLEVKNDTGWLARLATGILLLEGKDSGTNRQRLSVTNGGLSYRQPDMNLGSDLIFRDKDVVIAPTGEAEFPIVESLKKVLSIKEYDSGQVRGPYSNVNSSNHTQVWLYKVGNIVHCKIEMLAQFPNSGSFNDFDEVVIPEEFRPKYHVFCACPEVVAGTIVGNGRYRIGPKISLDVENATYAERTICTSWISAI
nr:MAG TPA: tail protein [Bacteriophage sp.]